MDFSTGTSTKTKVSIYLQNNIIYHYFSINKERFLLKWEEQIAEKGFFSEDNIKGNTVLINPNDCGLVEIEEVYG